VRTQPSTGTPVALLRGRIARIYFTGPRFTAGVLDCQGAMVRFAGPFAVAEDDAVVFEGHYEDTRWGTQLKVQKYRPDLKLDAQGLMRFLAASKRFKGIGEARARQLVERFGDEFDRIVVEQPERLTEVRGVTREIAEGVRDEWMRRRQQGQAIAALAAFGLTPYQVDRLLDAYGDSAVDVVRENPYVLIREVDGFGFRRADDVALRTGTERTNPHRLRAGIHYVMQSASDEGNSCLSFPDFLRLAVKLLMLDSADAFDRVRAAFAEAITEGELVQFQGADGQPHVALASLYRMETYVGEVFRTWGGGHVRQG